MPNQTTNNLSVVNNKESKESRITSRRTYGYRFYGGSTLKRFTTQEGSSGKSSTYNHYHFSETSASKASFNRKAAILPEIKPTTSLSRDQGRQMAQVFREKRAATRIPDRPRQPQRKLFERVMPVSEPDLVVATRAPSPPTMSQTTPEESKMASSSPFVAALWIRRMIRNRKSGAEDQDTNKFVEADDVKVQHDGDEKESQEAVADVGEVVERPVSAVEKISNPQQTTFGSSNTPRCITMSPKERKQAANSGLSAREKILERKRENANWAFLRDRMAHTKVYNAFSLLKFIVKNHKLTVLRVLGEGGYAKVYEVFNEDNELFALKVVDLSESKVKEELLKEISFLQKFKGNDRVIQICDYEYKDDTLLVLLERGERDLDSTVQKLIKEDRLTPSKLRYFWEEMLEVLQAVHSSGVIHADVKPSNFLLVSGQLKMIDFGLALEVPEGETWVKRNFVGGTKDFLSPETLSCYVVEEGVIRERESQQDLYAVVSYKSDIWALGIILYQWMYHGLAPYSSLPGGRLSKIAAIVSLDYPVPLDPLPDSQVLDTLKLCLEKDHNKRASIEQLLHHPFLRPSFKPIRKPSFSF